MKKKNVKITAIVLFLIMMAATASGCKPPEEQYVAPGELRHGREIVAPTDEEALKPYENTVTLRVLGVNYDPESNVSPTYNNAKAGPKNQSFNDLALEVLNIKLEYMTEISPAAYETQLNLRLNAGDLPDVFFTSNPTVYETMRKQGFLADLSDIFYGLNHDLQELYLQDFYPTLQTCMTGDKLYSFPSPVNPYEFAKRIYIRKDWMNIVGQTKLPSTAEELFDLARAFKTNAPAIAAQANYVSAGDIIPIGIHKELAYVDNYGPTGLFELFGAQVNSYLKDAGGSLYSSNTSGEMKTAVATIKQLYDEGLIAGDFYNKTSNSVATDTIAGQVGIIFGDWWVSDHPCGGSAANENTPNADWVAIELVGFGGKQALPIVKPLGISNYNLVSRKSKNPEAIAKLLNLFHDVYYNDDAIGKYGEKATPQGGFFHNWIPVKVWDSASSISEHYRVKEAFSELYAAGYRQDLNSALTRTDVTALLSGQYGSILKKMKTREINLHFEKGYAYFQYLRQKEEGLPVTRTPAVKAGFGIYDEMISSDGGYAYVSALSEGRKAVKYNYYYGTATPTMTSKGEYLNTLLVGYFSEVIMGQNSINNWDSYFVSNYNSNGGSKILGEINEWYSKQLPLVLPGQQ